MGREVAECYFERLKSRDAKTVAESFHTDIVSWDPLAGELRGKEAVTAAFAGLFQQMPDVSFEPKRYVIDGQNGAVEWVWTGTGPRGKVVIPGMDLMEFAAGTIRSIKFYYDPAPLR